MRLTLPASPLLDHRSRNYSQCKICLVHLVEKYTSRRVLFSAQFSKLNWVSNSSMRLAGARKAMTAPSWKGEGDTVTPVKLTKLHHRTVPRREA